jgi:hypothetical protein
VDHNKDGCHAYALLYQLWIWKNDGFQLGVDFTLFLRDRLSYVHVVLDTTVNLLQRDFPATFPFPLHYYSPVRWVSGGLKPADWRVRMEKKVFLFSDSCIIINHGSMRGLL